MADVDYYSLLGIPRNANAKQIKDAYHKAARTCHPDHAGEAGTNAFKLVTQAFQILSDPELREEYDKGFRPVTSLADLYRRHYEGKKVMEIMLPTAPAAKQIGPDLYTTVHISTEMMKNGGNIEVVVESGHKRVINLAIPPSAYIHKWCRLPHLGSPGRNGAESGDLWIQLVEKKTQ